MDHYLDIRVLPDPEFTSPQLMNALFSKFHRFRHDKNLALSFPDMSKTLGSIMRIHGFQTDLNHLMDYPWLKGLRDYCNVAGILRVEEIKGYRSVFRKNVPGSIEKNYRRSVNKGWLSEEMALAAVVTAKERKTPTLPYVEINSTSTQQRFKIFIDQGPIVNDGPLGGFNSYGLSTGGNIPWF